LFEWTEDLYGIRPIEGQNGTFGGRETRLETCTCGAGNSFYIDTDSLCEEQSDALHAAYHNFDSVETMRETIEKNLAAQMLSKTLLRRVLVGVIVIHKK